jgi:probable F420-dependent oxidoreductase
VSRPRLSISCVPTDRGPRFARFARAVEEFGFDGLWVADHTHVPVDRRSPYPGGGDLPDRYRRNLEPLAALAMAASVTSRIRLGTGVLLAGARDPIVTAKALATIDQQSGGRLAVGVGHGWNREELADHGVEFATRRKRTRESVAVMRRLWESSIAAYDGCYTHLSPSWSWPKPERRPPVLVGGAAGPRVFAEVEEFGDGWIAVGGSGLGPAVAALRAVLERRDRDPAALEVVVFTTARQASEAKTSALGEAGATEVAFEILLTDPVSPFRAVEELAEAIAVTPGPPVPAAGHSRP